MTRIKCGYTEPRPWDARSQSALYTAPPPTPHTPHTPTVHEEAGYTMKPPMKPKVGSFQAMGLSEELFRGVSAVYRERSRRFVMAAMKSIRSRRSSNSSRCGRKPQPVSTIAQHLQHVILSSVDPCCIYEYSPANCSIVVAAD